VDLVTCWPHFKSGGPHLRPLTLERVQQGPHRDADSAACRRTSARSHAISMRSGGLRASVSSTAARAASATAAGVAAPDT